MLGGMSQWQMWRSLIHIYRSIIIGYNFSEDELYVFKEISLHLINEGHKLIIDEDVLLGKFLLFCGSVANVLSH
jgi:hypothetical protein